MESERWSREHPEDELVLNIGRTWRLGPKPPYMTIWKINDASVLQRWSGEFQTPKVIADHDRFNEVATIVDGGLYEDLAAKSGDHEAAPRNCDKAQRKGIDPWRAPEKQQTGSRPARAGT